MGTISSLLAQSGDPYCLEFESIAAGDYTVGQSIAEDGILMTFPPYPASISVISKSDFGQIGRKNWEATLGDHSPFMEFVVGLRLRLRSLRVMRRSCPMRLASFR